MLFKILDVNSEKFVANAGLDSKSHIIADDRDFTPTCKVLRGVENPHKDNICYEGDIVVFESEMYNPNAGWAKPGAVGVVVFSGGEFYVHDITNPTENMTLLWSDVQEWVSKGSIWGMEYPIDEDAVAQFKATDFYKDFMSYNEVLGGYPVESEPNYLYVGKDSHHLYNRIFLTPVKSYQGSSAPDKFYWYNTTTRYWALVDEEIEMVKQIPDDYELGDLYELTTPDGHRYYYELIGASDGDFILQSTVLHTQESISNIDLPIERVDNVNTMSAKDYIELLRE